LDNKLVRVFPYVFIVQTVNGTSGDGMSLSVEERKQTAERWQTVSQELKITTMIQIGGAPFADVVELAIHAESIKVDSILCLPELYFKPKTEEELVKYLRDISEFCPTTPLLYYHIPWMSGVNCKKLVSSTCSND